MNPDNPARIDLSPLHDDAKFRAAYLYYLQLANSYIAQIFFGTISRGQSAKRLYKWLENNRNENWNKHTISQAVFDAIVPDETTRKRSGYLDCYDLDFANLLKNISMPDSDLDGLGKRFFYNLSFYHCIVRGEDSFLSDLAALRNKRNNIMHKTNPPPDTRVIAALGVLLLPKLHQHFIGEVRAANARAKRVGHNQFAQVPPIDLAFRSARKSRAEATERIFGTRKRPGLAGTDKKTHTQLKHRKKLRQDKEMAKQSFMLQYKKLYPENAWPRYNYHGFRIRKSFIGDQKIKAIRALLNLPDGKVHFSRDIEPLYNTAMKINAELAKLFMVYMQADEKYEKQVRERLKKTEQQDIYDQCNDHDIDIKKSKPELVEILVKYTLKGDSDTNKENKLTHKYNQYTKADLEKRCQGKHQGITKKLSKLRSELAQKLTQDGKCLSGDLQRLANAVRHNTLFFMAPDKVGKPLPVSEVFLLAFSGLLCPHVRKNIKFPLQEVDNYYGVMINILRRQDYDWAFVRNPQGENKQPPPVVIRNWSRKNRTEYLNFNKYRLDRRQNVRAVFARWANAVTDARAGTWHKVKQDK